MPFDDDEKIPQPKKHLGLKQSNPVREKVADPKQVFDEKANQAFADIEDYKQKMWDFSIQFKSFIETQVLPDNRGPIANSLEKETLDNLIALAAQMNEDDNQPEGMGNIALNMLLLKCMLLQRDKINLLRYEVSRLSSPSEKKSE